MRVAFAVLDPRPREEWVEVPLDLTDPAAGTVRVRFREIPGVEWSRLLALYGARVASWRDVTRARDKRRGELAALHTGPDAGLVELLLGEEYAEAIAEAHERRRDIEREIVARGVTGHDPESFRVEVEAGEDAEGLRRSLAALGLSEEQIAAAISAGFLLVEFKGEAWRLKRDSEPRIGASPQTVQFYERCAPGFLDILVGTIHRLQSGQVLTAAELYEQARRRAPREVLEERRAALEKTLGEVNAALAEISAEEAAADPLAPASPGSLNTPGS